MDNVVHFPYLFTLISYLSQNHILVRDSLLQQNTKNKVGKEGVYLTYTYTSLFIMEGSLNRNSINAETCRQKLMQRPLRSAAYCLVPYILFSLFSYRIQNQQPMFGITNNALNLHSSITDLKNPLETCLQPNILDRCFCSIWSHSCSVLTYNCISAFPLPIILLVLTPAYAPYPSTCQSLFY